MEKKFKQIEREIRDTFVDNIYGDVNDTEKILSDIIGKNVSMYDSKIDDGVDDDEDNYLMCDCFSTDDDTITIRIYYGDETNLISDVDISITAR